MTTKMMAAQISKAGGGWKFVERPIRQPGPARGARESQSGLPAALLEDVVAIGGALPLVSRFA